jgi:single-stranded-DNA-specific exonuclease
MRWNYITEPKKEKINHLSQVLKVSPTVSKLLLNRGIETYEQAKTFFRPSLEDLHNPFLMKDMDIAVNRIEKAISNGENIMIYGDYDVDGTTSVSLVYSYLSKLYPNITTYIPDRYEEGYGISYKGIDFASDNDISLIIALDCGIKAIEKIAYAKEKNIDFIICDHHRPGENVPDAVAILNPKQVDCNYPYDELCGCGIGFKLIQAIQQKRNLDINEILNYLDLVATAIAADIVPMTGENRILSYFGLQVINNNPRIGIKALLSSVKKDEITITDVVFVVAPRINAAGRIKTGNAAVELLIEKDLSNALEFAKSIENFNIERKELDKKITIEALLQIKDNKEEERFTTVVYDKNWHKGVIGIVASRLIEKYYRPTLVFTKSGDYLAASARSVKGFDIYEALEKSSEFIEQFGGHKYAAGLTLKPENYEKFKAKFEEVVKQTIPKELLIPEIKIDTEIDFSEITPKLNRIIKQFAPFGPQNMKPVFASNDVRDNGYGKPVGADKSHIKLDLIQGSHFKTYPAIGFGLAEKYNEIPKSNGFNIAYTIEENHWNNKVTLQLNLKDISV